MAVECLVIEVSLFHLYRSIEKKNLMAFLDNNEHSIGNWISYQSSSRLTSGDSGERPLA